MKKWTKVGIGAGLVGGVLLVGGLMQGIMSLWPHIGAGGGPGGNGGDGGKGSAVVSGVVEPPPPPPPPKPEPLEITIDDNKYLVKGVEVGSVDELVRMAAAVPKEVPLPRVRVLLRRTSRYVTEHALTEALQAANVEFVAIEE